MLGENSFMKWATLSVRQKLCLGFGLLVVLSLGMAGLATFGIRQARNNQRQLAEVNMAELNANTTIMRYMAKIRVANRSFGLTGEAKYASEASAAITTATLAIETLRKAAQNRQDEKIDKAYAESVRLLNAYAEKLAATGANVDQKAELVKKLEGITAEYAKSCDAYYKDQMDKVTSEALQGDLSKLRQRMEKIAAVVELGKLGTRITEANFRTMATRNAKYLEEALPMVERIRQEADRLARNSTQGINREQLLALTASAEQMQAAIQELAKNLEENQALQKARSGIAETLSTSIDENAGHVYEDAKAGAEANGHNLNLLMNELLLVLAVIVLLSAAAMWYFPRMVALPIQKYLLVFEKMAGGDLTSQVEVTSQDELGHMGEKLNQLLASLRQLLGQVIEMTHEVASAATEIAASSEEMSSGMREQTAQTQQVSVAVEEMSSTVVEVARKSADAATTANHAGEQALQGGQVVSQTIEGMQAIAAVVNESAASIAELGKRGEQIGNIISVINDIADQTNLLALNAAIEAARAGEHGRGFAVVADEVRKLAERTTHATKEVGDSIKAIQHETNVAVEKMNAGTERVGKGVELAQQAGNALETIVSGAQGVSGMIQSIAAASDQQSTAAEEIARNIELINAVTRQSGDGASQAAAAAIQLSAKSEQLQHLVSRFKI
jgi:methyl-accepting chemotaxis protein